MARFVDPKEVVRAEYERDVQEVRARRTGHRSIRERIRDRVSLVRLLAAYQSRSWLLWWNRDDLAVQSFTAQTEAGKVEALLSSRGDLEMFLFDATDKPTKFGVSLVANKSQLAEALGWLGMGEKHARQLAAHIWDSVQPRPRRFGGVRHFWESGTAPQPVYFGGPPG